MKIGAATIILIGVSLAVCALAYGFFHSWQPKGEEITNKEKELADLQAENAKAPAVDRKVKLAEQQVMEKAKQWRGVVATKTPPTSVEMGGINLAVTAYQLTVDSQRFRDSIQRAVNAQSKKGGVKVIAGLQIPAPTDDPGTILPTFYNYPSPFQYPVVLFNLGAITVRGTYAQIMANVRSWAAMPNYLAVADGLTITGTSPTLVGTYNVSIVGFIRATKIGPPAVAGGGTQNAGG